MRWGKNAHYKKIRNLLLLILVANWGVAMAKIIYGLLTRCSSMTADGFHSFSDGASNIIGIIGITLAYKPKDSSHPYGHKKYETLFSLGIAALLVFVAINLFQKGVSRFYHKITPSIDTGSFLVMAITIFLNYLVMVYEKNNGQQLKSDILVSDAMHTKADIFTSFSVIAALIGIKIGFPIIDPIVTLLIASFIIRAAYEIIKESSDVLCDSVAIVDLKKITDIVTAVKDVKACHKIRSRGRPDDIHIDLHVQVSPEMKMGDAHQISYAIEETIKKQIPQITDVVVHMEPKQEKQ